MAEKPASSPVPPTADPVPDEPTPVLLKLSEVHRQTGVDVDTLKMLIGDGLLVQGVERGRNGSVRMRADYLPTYQALLHLLREQLMHRLRTAQAHMRRVEREMEAVRNDLELAVADPAAPLGHDLLTLRTHSNDPRDTSLASALSGLQFATWAVQRYQEAVKRTEDLQHFQVD
jgi:hypothetical protein